MASILVHITVKSGHESEFEELARDLFSASHAAEDGLLRYEYWRGHQVGSYYTLMSFRSYNDFLAHQVSAHHEDAAAQLGAVIADLRLEWLDPVEGATELPAKSPEMQSQPANPMAPVDVVEPVDLLMRRAAKMFPMQVGSWWPVGGGDTTI